MAFADWTPEAPARIVDLRQPGAVEELTREYGQQRPRVVGQVFSQAFTLGAQMAVVEFRYLDPDYRSEHSQFYSTTFRRYPSVAHRIHFFADPPPATSDDLDAELDFEGLTYLGFTVLRPLPGARVGRTMLAAPAHLRDRVMCQAVDRINVFGHPITVRAAPFMAQDTQLGVCAHMTLWVTAYFHHLAYGNGRFSVADVADRVPFDPSIGRATPSAGLTVRQIAAGSTALGRPSLVYDCLRLPKRESIPKIACRYLNSGMPVIVAAGGRHAFVLVGYWRDHAGTPDERIRFIAQDDEFGPYQEIADFKHDRSGPWEYLVVPLPPKVFVPGEIAEQLGREQLVMTADLGADPAANELAERSRLAKTDPDSVSFRSTVIRSNRFKETLDTRLASKEVAVLYRRMQLPRWIWVVEAIGRGQRERGEPAVLGEAIIDATDHSRDMHFLALRVPGEMWSWLPDPDLLGSRPIEPVDPMWSVARFVLDPPLDIDPN